MNRISRRRLLGSSLAAGTVAALGACSASPGQTSASSESATGGTISDEERQAALDTETELLFWTWVPEIENEVALFQEAYPKISVTVENVGQGADHYKKLRTALQAGQGAPDVAQIEFQHIQSFTVTNNLLDLTPYGAADIAPQFVDWVWNQVQIGNGIWAIPQDSGPLGTLYRRDLFADAGLDGDMETWDDFRAAAETVRPSGGYLTCLSPNEAGQFSSFYWQAGARPFGYDGAETVTINLGGDELVKQVMDYWTGLLQDDLVANDPAWNDTWYQGLANGKYASWVTAAWGPVFLQGTAATTSGLWTATRVPQWNAGEDISGNWGGSSNAVMQPTQNPIAAYELAKWINTDIASTLMFANEQFFFPTTVKTLEDRRFTDTESEFFGGQRVNELFSEISGTVTPDFGWLPFMDYTYAQFVETVGVAITDRSDLYEATLTWEQSLKDYATQQGFTIA
ncbi:MAG: ABC transporter substrate-binding protein [Arachnia sp.]